MATARADIPQVFAGLLERHRYKVYYGGRGSGKSWTFATVLITRAAERCLRILCTRETMSSIRESVHQLLSDRIYALGLADQFVIGTTSIRHDNGSKFIFAGLRHNVSQIRSLEGIDIAWVEEAANISHSSWEILFPTIRKDGSEIWISFNPVLETDSTYERFVKRPQADSLVRHVSFMDNPWCRWRRESA
jgi:phage terminase large subunit